MPIRRTAPASFVQSLDRGLTILRAVALSKEAVSTKDLSELLMIDRSNASRLAQTLRRQGFLASPAGRKDYVLGSAIWVLSNQYDWGNMLVKIAHQHLKRIAKELNETAHLAIREANKALFIDSAYSKHAIAVAGQIGEFVPLYCSAHGKALLADADERELKSLFGSSRLQEYTQDTITNIRELAEECAEIKKRGFATDDAEYKEGMRCIAAPIRIANGSIVGSIGISVPEPRSLKMQYRDCSTKICRAAADIGTLLQSL